MTPPTEQIYTIGELKTGFLGGDAAAGKYIFTQVRPLVQKAITSIGGSHADGSAFFLAAIADFRGLLESDSIPEDTSVEATLSALAVAHYHTWKSFNSGEAVDIPATQASWIPSPEQLNATRKHIYTWKAVERMGKPCSEQMMAQASSDCMAQLTATLQPAVKAGEPLPDWVHDALLRKADYSNWKQFIRYEQYISRGLDIDGIAPKSTGGSVAKYAFIFLLFATLGYMAFAWWNKPKDAGLIFDEHFEPPQSLLSDINRRFENDTSGIVRPEACQTYLTQAERFYSEKNYREAAAVLLQMREDESLEICQSDALFGLAIVSLKMEDPMESLQYLAKIENIEAYGEDLYWYQSLAFVQLAKQNPGYRRPAKNAVERFLENTRNEARKTEAEVMLKDLQ